MKRRAYLQNNTKMCTHMRHMHSGHHYSNALFKIALYIQIFWQFQPKFLIYIFGVMVLQMKQKKKMKNRTVHLLKE